MTVCVYVYGVVNKFPDWIFRAHTECSYHTSQLSVRIVCDTTLAFSKRCNVLFAIIEMADFREQCTCIKFCFKLGRTATECYEMLKTAFGEQAMSCSQTFQWFSRFKAGRTSTDDDVRSGRPVSSSMPEMIERVHQIICEDRRSQRICSSWSNS